MSHNRMATFFSGTDMSELNDNTENHNFYLSLIVNNALEMTAKIAFIGEEESVINTTRTVPNETGGTKVMKFKETVKDKFLFTYDCDITYEIASVSKEFSDRVNTIIVEADKAEAAKKVEMSKSYKNFSTQGQTGMGYYQREMFQGEGYLGEEFVHGNSLNKASWLPEDNKKLTDLLIYCLTGDMDSKLHINHAIKEGYQEYKGTLEHREDYLASFEMTFVSMLPYYLNDKFDVEDESVYENVLKILSESKMYESHEDFILDISNQICV